MHAYYYSLAVHIISILYWQCILASNNFLLQTSLLDESQNLTEADDSLVTENETSKTFGESDSDSEDEDSGRGRFKTERNKIITISTTKARTNIPDTLGNISLLILSISMKIIS